MQVQETNHQSNRNTALATNKEETKWRKRDSFVCYFAEHIPAAICSTGFENATQLCIF
jgi:hypothetical protein